MILVVTGGCGFVGLNLLHHLVATGAHEIRIVDNLSNSRVEALVTVLQTAGVVRESGTGAGSWSVDGAAGPSRLSLTVADVRDETVAERVVEGADAVVHLAAQTGVQISLERPREDVTQNVIGTLNYLEACRHAGVDKFIVASSMAVVGEAEPPQSEDMPQRPASPYAASKAAIEGYCSAYFGSFGVKTLALRFANVYGPYAWSKGSVVAAFCKQGLSGKPLVVDGDGLQTRDFVHAGDLAAAIACVIGNTTKGPGDLFGRAINVASGRLTNVLYLARAVQDCLAELGMSSEIEFGPARPVDTRTSAPDTSLLRQLLPACSQRLLDEGLPETVRWFHENWTMPARA